MQNKNFETDGFRNGQPIYCPVNGHSCPHFYNGICRKNDPIKNCNDFVLFFKSWDDWDKS